MNTLVIDRSTDVQSAALMDEQTILRATTFTGLDARSGEWVMELRRFVGDDPVARLVIGTGPGSFAGIRAALAFAQGYAIGSGCQVMGLPSACAFAEEAPRIVIGDARRERFWVALFDGYRLVTDVFQTDEASLLKRVPRGVRLTTPDAKRIGAFLKEKFGDDFDGGDVPTAEGLARFALHNPSALKAEPLPLYLNPAVRD